MANAGILAIVNAGAEAAGLGNSTTIFAVQFIIALIVFAVAQRYVMVSATKALERAIHEQRMELLRRVRDAELADLEKFGRSQDRRSHLEGDSRPVRGSIAAGSCGAVSNYTGFCLRLHRLAVGRWP